MESTGTAPRVGVDPSELRELVEGPGPYLTVYLGTDPDVENAGMRSERRWKAVRRQLGESGAPESVLDLVEALVPDAHLHGRTLAVVADDAEVLRVEHLDEPLDRDRASWARLPDLAPLIRWRQSHPPYVLVLADHGGADLIAERPRQDNLERTVGDDEPMRKVAPGGWSQRRYQQRADNDWAGTAADVAAQVSRLAKAVDARLVILGGDVRATHLIRADLRLELLERTHVIAHGRATDGSEAERSEEVHRLVATAVAEDTVALLERFKEERGQLDRAVDGRAATVDSLNRAAVDILLVPEEAEGVAWVGSDPVPLGLDDDGTMPETGRLDRAPLVDALIRGAVGTGASVRVIPAAGPVREGIGALLRWPTRADVADA